MVLVIIKQENNDLKELEEKVKKEK